LVALLSDRYGLALLPDGWLTAAVDGGLHRPFRPTLLQLILPESRTGDAAHTGIAGVAADERPSLLRQ